MSSKSSSAWTLATHVGAKAVFAEPLRILVLVDLLLEAIGME